jgi:hypothetical protein
MISSSDLGAALESFILEHEYCGELDGWTHRLATCIQADGREVSDCSPTRLRTGAEVYELDRSDCLH